MESTASLESSQYRTPSECKTSFCQYLRLVPIFVNICKIFFVNICGLRLSTRRLAPCIRPCMMPGAGHCRHAGPHAASPRLTCGPAPCMFPFAGIFVFLLRFFFYVRGVTNGTTVLKTRSRRIEESRDCFAWLVV